ncbi:MAG: methyltransferase domain-containing protein [Terriglobia bacterium]|jgi:ubiquinone/menaquinone biosynthesis C-methylase UbiE
MSTKASPDRWLQLAALATAGLFILGFVFSPLGAWTGVILATWLIGTQKAWRGFLWLVGFALILQVPWNWRGLPLTGSEYLGWALLAVLISVLPYLLSRLVTLRREGFLSTLALPLWGAALQTVGQRWLPTSIFNHYSLAQTQHANAPLLHIATILGAGSIPFLIYWSAAVIIWMWNNEFQGKKIAVGASIFGAVWAVTLGYGFFPQISHAYAPHVLLTSTVFAWTCFAGSLILTVGILLLPGRQRKVWADKTETVALLRSPYTGNPLHVVSKGGHEVLVSSSGEQFPIRNEIAVFLEPEKATASNRKYNRLYETIGGFYDDTQRVACALRGVKRDRYFLSYLGFLEINPGNSVLETSVGTGLNYKYVPRGVKLFGLDLSTEMLRNCQTNLRRWDLDADLFLGNAEELPFADDSFDVVFHVGGINFFNDRAKAIREMIRVAKPGSRILIADETEKHVKSTYEHIPITSGYFKNRQQAVTVPIDLVPPEMQEIHLETLWDGRFYALTFRKPSSAMPKLAVR